MLARYKLSVALVKQIVGAMIAVVSYLIIKNADPELAAAIIPIVGPILTVIATIVFGVDVAGLAMQNAEEKNKE